MVPEIISDLCERFERNREQYRSAAYNEAQLRQEFLNPLFKALGWDMENEQGFAEAYKDVVHEDSIRVEGSVKAPDYCFRIGGTKKFFLEAKKPSVFVKDDAGPAYQLRRYAWSAKLPLSILTNFEEFAVYDCRYRPAKEDKASSHRLLYFKQEEYASRWEEIANVFTRDAILKGSFDKYAADVRGKRGTQEVDDEFLSDIEEWRTVLARNFALRNKKLAAAELNFAVGRTIDRLLFLRVCEDRKIEEYGQIKALLKGENKYKRLLDLFKRADERYNSGLFHFRAEKGRHEQPDVITPALELDDKVLKGIIETLYYPESPYEFSVFPADILGQVYEQFLGKVIVPKGKTVDVEFKPEVKKAGGVYYTPTYIVDYIVKQTVGKLLEGKTPKDVETLRVLDPACGSGSFLIGAYQFLLDWHLGQYVRNESKLNNGLKPIASPKNVKLGKGLQPLDVPLCQNGRGEWRLTLAERKRILLANIYGVDIDAQAVEVTKLSLLLKVLEGESEATVQGELKLRHHALPDLGDNIKCGNSLIGKDFATMFPDLPSEELSRVNPFDWKSEFPEVFKAGGFDAVIGNPPWISLKGKFGNEIASMDEIQYLSKIYCGDTYRPNIYEYFVKRAISLVRTGGLQSFIVPDRLGFNEQFAQLRRELILKGQFLHLLYKARFPNIIADTLIYVYSLQDPSEDVKVEIGEFHGDRTFMNQNIFLDLQDCLFLQQNPIVHKVYYESINIMRLGNVVSSNVGFIAAANTITEKRINPKQQPILRGRNVQRYGATGQAYFHLKKENLVGGTQSPEKLSSKPKILMRKTGFPLPSTLDETGTLPEQSLYFLYCPQQGLNLKFLLGIVNSKLFQYIYFSWMVTNRDSTPQLKKIHLDEFPIRTIDFSDKADKARHDKLAKLVERMLELNRTHADTKAPEERTKLERQIAATDGQIDALVYELYGLTEEEIGIVEGKS